MNGAITLGEKIVHEGGEVYTFSLADKPKLIDLLVDSESRFASVEEEVVQHITMTKEEAKQAVSELFRERGELGYSDIMETLGFDLDVIVEVCAELEDEGKIRVLSE